MLTLQHSATQYNIKIQSIAQYENATNIIYTSIGNAIVGGQSTEETANTSCLLRHRLPHRKQCPISFLPAPIAVRFRLRIETILCIALKSHFDHACC